MGLGLVALESNAEHELLNAAGKSPIHYSIASPPSGAGDEDDADEVADDEAPVLDAIGGSLFGDVPPSAWRQHRRRTKLGSRPANPSGPAPSPGDGGGASRSRTSPSASRPTPYGTIHTG